MRVLGPASGEQACGEVGVGRMLEPTQIADEIFTTRGGAGPLHGLKVVVTAGPTRETHRSGAIHQQSQLRQDGLCGRQAAREAGAKSCW